MEENPILRLIAWGFLIFLILLSWAIGNAAGNGWAGVCVGIGIFLGLLASDLSPEHQSAYLVTSVVSSLFLGVGAFISRLQGGWWWAAAWGIMAISHFKAAIAYWNEEDKSYMRVALLSSLFFTLLAFLSPTVLAPFWQNKSISLARSWEIWIPLVLATIALAMAWHQGYLKKEGAPFVVWTFLGLALLIIATWFSGLRGGWWWSIPWGGAALVIVHAAHELHEYYERGAARFGYVITALCLFLAFAIPGFLPRYLGPSPLPPTMTATVTPSAQTPTPKPTVTPQIIPTPLAEPTPSASGKYAAKHGWQALGVFLGATIRSVWGVIYLIVLFLFGYSWFRRKWAALLLIFILLSAVWLAGSFSLPITETLTRFITAKPATWMREMLRGSIENWGTMGWGILLTSMATVLLLLPALRCLSKFNYVLAINDISTSRMQESSEMRKLVAALKSFGVYPGLTLINLLLVLFIPVSFFIALWTALRQVGGMGTLPLGFIILPDLTVPHWKPVWNWSYFLLALLVLLATNFFIWIQKKLEPTPKDYFQLNKVMLIPGILVGAVLFPAGVMLFSLGCVLTNTLFLPFRLQGISMDVYKLEVELRQLKQKLNNLEKEKKNIEAELRLSKEKQKELMEELKRTREELEECRKPAKKYPPLVGMAILEDSKWFLTEKNILFVKADTLEQINLPIQKGVAVLPLRESSLEHEGEMLVIGDGNRILKIGRKSRDTLKMFVLSNKIDAFALNSYKTLLAWVNVSEGLVGGLFLESGREVIFASALEVTPALAFSVDGRYIAVGTPDGRIYLVDVASRQVDKAIQLPESSASFGKAIRYLIGRRDGGWLAIHEKGRIVMWDNNYQVEQEQPALRRRLDAIAFHPASERLAFGLSEGNIQVFDAHLKQIFVGQVEGNQVSFMDFSPDGKTLFVICDRTTIREVKLS